MTTATPDDAPPRRLGPEALKALTHPLRTRMWEYLRDHGSATATQLARAMGESSGQTSYHLRQLERFGFIEDDPDRPAGRERWWRPVGFQVTPEDLLDDDVRQETLTLLRAHLAGRTAFVLDWIGRHRDEPREWLDASATVESTLLLTAAELEALTNELEDVVRRHGRAARALVASEGAGAAGDGTGGTGTAGTGTGGTGTAGTGTAGTGTGGTGTAARRRVRVFIDALPVMTVGEGAGDGARGDAGAPEPVS